MKQKSIFVLSILLLVFKIQAQESLKVEAGPDRHICTFYPVSVTLNGNTLLGGAPSATGGQPPYTYQWTYLRNYINNVNPATYTTASNILSNAGVSNPTLTFFPVSFSNPGYILLTVTDAVGNTAKDSLKVSRSEFGIRLIDYSCFITKGDSVFLNSIHNVFGLIAPFSYQWAPLHGLSNSTSYSFWAKPDYNISYSVTVTDSMGCSATGGPLYNVYVSPVGIVDRDNLDYEIHLLSNPTNLSQTIVISSKTDGNCQVNLYDLTGQYLKTVYTGRIQTGKNSIDNSIAQLNKGIYLYKITVNGKTSTKKFVKD